MERSGGTSELGEVTRQVSWKGKFSLLLAVTSQLTVKSAIEQLKVKTEKIIESSLKVRVLVSFKWCDLKYIYLRAEQ